MGLLESSNELKKKKKKHWTIANVREPSAAAEDFPHPEGEVGL